jgi:hypothetical protein
MIGKSSGVAQYRIVAKSSFKKGLRRNRGIAVGHRLTEGPLSCLGGQRAGLAEASRTAPVPGRRGVAKGTPISTAARSGSLPVQHCWCLRRSFSAEELFLGRREPVCSILGISSILLLSLSLPFEQIRTPDAVNQGSCLFCISSSTRS